MRQHPLWAPGFPVFFVKNARGLQWSTLVGNLSQKFAGCMFGTVGQTLVTERMDRDSIKFVRNWSCELVRSWQGARLFVSDWSHHRQKFVNRLSLSEFVTRLSPSWNNLQVVCQMHCDDDSSTDYYDIVCSA